ncbi:MAG: magnesium transporter [Candidatus Uhrbacteria bacterium]
MSQKPSFPKNAIGHHILEQVPTGRQNTTVEAMRKELMERASEWDTVNYIYVIDSKNKALGVISIKELLKAAPRQKLQSLMCQELVLVHPYTRKERAAMLAIRQNLKQLPVVKKNGILMGVFGSDDVINTLHSSHVEDIIYYSGLTSEKMQIQEILRAGIAKLVRMRLPWLLVGLAGGIVATFVISYFEGALEEIIALAFFIPVIVYMGDAVGHQTQLIFIRSLGNEEINLKTYVLREVAVDFIIGIILALGLIMFAQVWLDSSVAAMIIGLTMFINIFKAGSIALGIPLLLQKMKKDPALGAGPFTTTVQDLLSIIIYFAIATLFLG